ncbi:MAG TPA: hypothetical protein HPP87_04230 [Planctomycetes bacterium]|nr:hypothetical protein [Planctomycetota bacterium]
MTGVQDCCVLLCRPRNDSKSEKLWNLVAPRSYLGVREGNPGFLRLRSGQAKAGMTVGGRDDQLNVQCPVSDVEFRERTPGTGPGAKRGGLFFDPLGL